MEKKKFTPLMTCHLILMSVLIVLNAIIAVAFFTASATPELKASMDEWSSAIYTSAIWNIVNILALGCGIVYLVRGYSKQAADYYKAFLLLTVLANVVLLVVTVMLPGSTGASLLLILKIILLILLAAWQNLGRRNSWIVLAILVAADLIVGFFIPSADGTVRYQISAALSRLIIDGTIALALKGKYDDKAARGRE